MRVVIFLSVLIVSIATFENVQQYLQTVRGGFNCCISDVPTLRAYQYTSKESSSQRDSLIVGDLDGESTCLRHVPMHIHNASHLETITTDQTTVLAQPTLGCGKLRRDWTSNPVRSPLALQIQAQQNNCSLPAASFYVDDSFGLGSHLNVWSQAMCNAMQDAQRVRTYNPNWIWMDQEYCGADQAKRSPLLCYFPLAEDRCRHAAATTQQYSWSDEPWALNVTSPKNERLRCSLVREQGMLADFRTASTEYLFQSLSPLIIREAQRQLGALFGPEGQAPDDMITVHLRWGDKFWEMDLVHENEYVAAVSQLLFASGRPDNTTANVYLATEDPRAVEAFRNAAPSGWTIYVDRTIAELDDYRPKKGNRASWAAKNTRGRAGLVALGSLLVAMESNYFVLTTKSNWSRLMDQLRKTMIDRKCGNCTMAIDLAPGDW